MVDALSTTRFAWLRGLAAPAACAVVLLAIAGWDTLRVDAHVADAFHARVAQAVRDMPLSLYTRQSVHPWVGQDQPLPQAAVRMLKPNATLCRCYWLRGQAVTLLLTQCRDSRDMLGHYPPVCYSGQGYVFSDVDSTCQWTDAVTAKAIPYTKYDIERKEEGQTKKLTVCDFFVLPDGRIVREMASVTRACKDYRALAFGVAQIQLLMDAGLTCDRRNEIFHDLIGGNRALIEALGSARDLGVQR